MIELQPDEQVILEVRRHWFFFLLESAFLLVLLFLPVLGVGISSAFEGVRASENFWPLAAFFAAAWWLLTWNVFAVLWTNYYLDLWIITSKRVVDVEQHGLFSRQISECRLDRVQDVTVEVHGVLATLLKIGNVHIQTAGETANFVLRSVPHPYEVKEALSKCQADAVAALHGVPHTGGH